MYCKSGFLARLRNSAEPSKITKMAIIRLQNNFSFKNTTQKQVVKTIEMQQLVAKSRGFPKSIASTLKILPNIIIINANSHTQSQNGLFLMPFRTFYSNLLWANFIMTSDIELKKQPKIVKTIATTVFSFTSDACSFENAARNSILK